jgi:hypothetical protein
MLALTRRHGVVSFLPTGGLAPDPTTWATPPDPVRRWGR